MKKSDKEWYKMLLEDPKLRREWLKHVEEERHEEIERMKQHFALQHEDRDEDDS